jgi:glycosyltransferase involved in cell wall biosynthesis
MISVIIPTYNRAHKVKRAIQSVLDQTFTDFEILVMDDGSTDNTKEVIKEFNDERIIYHYDSNSGGPARPRNKGISFAKGGVIAFLDSDDWWAPNKLAKSLNALEINQTDFIYHDLWKVSSEQLSYDKKIEGKAIDIPVFDNLLEFGNCIPNSSVLVKKKLLEQAGTLDESRRLIAAEDYDMWLRVSMITNNFFYLNECLGFYNSSGEGISEKINKLTNDIFVCKKYLKYVSDKKAFTLLAERYYPIARRCLSKHKYNASFVIFVFCAKHSSSRSIQLKSILFLLLSFILNEIQHYWWRWIYWLTPVRSTN